MHIFIEEEYGYRYWVWSLEKDKSEIIQWWENLESVDDYFFNPSKSLPFGKVSPLPEDCMNLPDTEGYLHLHMDEDSYLRFNGVIYYHKGYTKLI